MSAVIKSAFKFRAMHEADFPDVLAIENRVYPFPWSETNFRDSIQAGYHCEVLMQDDLLVGYAILMTGADESHLLNLTINDQCQRLGHGTFLLRHLIGVARECASVLLLEVRPSNTAGRALYAGFGFSQIGLRRGYYPALINGTHSREDALVLSYKL